MQSFVIPSRCSVNAAEVIKVQVNRGLVITFIALLVVALIIWLWYLRARSAAYGPVEVPSPGPGGPQAAPVQEAPLKGAPGQTQKATPYGL